MSTRRSLAVVVLTAATAAGAVACTGSQRVDIVRATPTASGAGSSPTVGPATPAPRPAPRVRPGQLIDRVVPADRRRIGVDIAFSGTVVAAGPRWERVVYPWLHLTAGDTIAYAHVKLPYFRCPAGADPRATPRASCRGRYVRYADADERTVRVSVDGDDITSVDITAAPYVFGRGVDRAPGLPARSDGRPVRLHVVVRPGAVVEQDRSRLVWRPLASLRFGRGSAQQDDGYANRYALALHD